MIATARGKIEEAESSYRDAMEVDEERGHMTFYHRDAVRIALSRFWLRDDTARARKVLRSALTRHPLDSIRVLDRGYHNLALAFAQIGQPVRARSLLEEAENSIPEYMHSRFKYQLYRIRGWIALAEGRIEEAAVHFDRLWERKTWDNEIDRFFAMGLIHEVKEQPDSVIAYYERLTASPFKGWRRAGWYQPRALERLGQLYEEQGDEELAIRHYSRLIELWKDCDPELEPRVEAARKALAQLTTMREGL